MIKRRIIVFILLLAAVVLCFGCGNRQDSDNSVPAPESQDNTNVVETDTDLKENNDNIQPTIVDETIYTINCIDVDGFPVPGASILICDDEMCTMQVSDDEGRISFNGTSMNYEYKVRSVPEGFLKDKYDIVIGEDPQLITIIFYPEDFIK